MNKLESYDMNESTFDANPYYLTIIYASIES